MGQRAHTDFLYVVEMILWKINANVCHKMKLWDRPTHEMQY